MTTPPIVIDCILTATGTGSSAIRVLNTAQIFGSALSGETQDILVQDASLAQVDGNTFNSSTLEGSGVLEPLNGDRGVWNALTYPTRHTNDLDADSSIHHTLNNISSFFVSNALDNGSIFIGGADNLAHAQAVSGDASISNAGVVTLTTVNPDVGTFGDETHLAQITVDEKGRITAIGEIIFAHAGQHVELVVTGLVPSDPVLTPDGSDFVYAFVPD